jgi:hypothetical protein
VINPPSASDEVIAGFPTAAFTINKTSSGARSITLGTGYSSIQWWVDDVDKTSLATEEGGKKFIVEASAYSLGKHTLTVIVSKAGVPYSNEVDFTVAQ